VTKFVFYQLSHQTKAEAMALLLPKVLSAGWSAFIRASETTVALLDDQLWVQPEAGFLPHALAASETASASPIVLGQQDGPHLDRSFDCIFCLDGEGPSSQEREVCERVCVVFDGQNPDELSAARTYWKDFSSAGYLAEYWSQETGAWVKKAESAPKA